MKPEMKIKWKQDCLLQFQAQLQQNAILHVYFLIKKDNPNPNPNLYCNLNHFPNPNLNPNPIPNPIIPNPNLGQGVPNWVLNFGTQLGTDFKSLIEWKVMGWKWWGYLLFWWGYCIFAL